MLEHKEVPHDRRRVWVNADKSKVVDEGSPEAAFMLHAEDAEKLGLKVKPAAQEKAQEPAEDKAVKPAANKAVKPAANKAVKPAANKAAK